jgi:hypothetical protein
MAIEKDGRIEWQLFIDGVPDLDAVLSAVKEAGEGELHSEPSRPDWGGKGFRIWTDYMVGDVTDGHPYETDGPLDYPSFRFLVDFESGRKPGRGHSTREFADRLFAQLRTRGARRMLMVDEVQHVIDELEEPDA